MIGEKRINYQFKNNYKLINPNHTKENKTDQNSDHERPIKNEQLGIYPRMKRFYSEQKSWRTEKSANQYHQTKIIRSSRSVDELQNVKSNSSSYGK